ncbi:MAG TPA: hypothetical protein VLQ29_11650 [Candidatus Dormibacteraeota bacterium]|nr:hypothetical protein [Candidatus Dormibacteraeota bacterium]
MTVQSNISAVERQAAERPTPHARAGLLIVIRRCAAKLASDLLNVIQIYPAFIAISSAGFSLGAILHLQDRVYFPISVSRHGRGVVEKVLRVKHQQAGYAHQQFSLRLDPTVQLTSGEVRMV